MPIDEQMMLMAVQNTTRFCMTAPQVKQSGRSPAALTAPHIGNWRDSILFSSDIGKSARDMCIVDCERLATMTREMTANDGFCRALSAARAGRQMTTMVDDFRHMGAPALASEAA